MARTTKLAVVAFVVAWLLFDGGSAVGQGEGFTIDTPSEPARVLAELDVTGRGCPPTTDAPAAVLLLAPPGGSEGLGSAVVDGIPTFVLPAVSVPGQVQLDAPLMADGSFSVTFEIPGDAPPSPDYVVFGGCASLLELSEDGQSVTPESFDAATAATGEFAVLDASSACDPSVDCPDDRGSPDSPGLLVPPRALPSFTG